MPALIRAILAAVLLGLTVPAARAEVELRVSVKFILSAGGNLPSNGGPLTSHAAVQDQINTANRNLERYGRGYRLRLTEVVDLAGVSSWYNAQARNSSNKVALEAAASSDPAAYAWRSDAANVYINNSASGICSFPPANVIFIGSSSYDPVIFHELGHYFNLLHTHQGELVSTNCSRADGSGNVDSPGNNDGANDTPPDHECWTRDQVAQNAFGMVYLNLAPFFQNQVDNTYSNIMSYHLPQDRLTADQLDRLTDAANGPRNNVATGRTIFVDQNNTCPSPNDLIEPFKTIANALTDIPYGSLKCKDYVLAPPLLEPLVVSLGGPFRKFADGLGAAASGDVVLVRAGNYNEPRRITQRVTLVGSRGNVSIGKP